MVTSQITMRSVGQESSPAFNAREFRNAMGKFATGVSVITTQHQDRTHGMTANAFMSVSLEPPLVLVSLDNRSLMHQILPATGLFGVSVLAEGQEAISNHFAGRTVDGVRIGFISRRDVPLLEGAVAYFIARVVNVHAAGDHSLYIGLVEHFESVDARPLLFYSGNYERVSRKNSGARR